GNTTYCGDIALSESGDPWRRDLYSGQRSYPISNIIVSVNASGTATGNRASWQPSVSIDDKWVAFYSLATDLTTNVINPSSTESHLFVRNVVTSRTKLIDRDTNGVPLADGATNPVYS